MEESHWASVVMLTSWLLPTECCVVVRRSWESNHVFSRRQLFKPDDQFVINELGAFRLFSKTKHKHILRWCRIWKLLDAAPLIKQQFVSGILIIKTKVDWCGLATNFYRWLVNQMSQTLSVGGGRMETLITGGWLSTKYCLELPLPITLHLFPFFLALCVVKASRP